MEEEIDDCIFRLMEYVWVELDLDWKFDVKPDRIIIKFKSC